MSGETVSNETEHCGTCFYWRDSHMPLGGSPEERENNKECREDSPALSSGGITGVWPTTHQSEWCGKWTREPRREER